MAKFHSFDTTPELIIRKLLHNMGYKFRLLKKNYWVNSILSCVNITR